MNTTRITRARATIVGLLFAPVLALSASALLNPLSASATSPTVSIPLNTAHWSGNAGFGSTAPAWSIESDSVVHLQGAVKQISTSGDANLIGTLPAAARPNRTVFTLVHTFNGTYADLGIQSNGQIRLIDPRSPAVKDYSFVSLEGISYYAKTGTSLSVNTANWSASAGFSSAAPAWHQDDDGFVHLQGAAKQVSTGGDASLLGTLPAAVTPCVPVYTIAHTFQGTYAALMIETNGQIRPIGPDAPAVQDYTFVSLEGITYSVYGGCSAAFTPLAVNTANWLAAGSGSATPGSYTDADFKVHLQGLVMQTATSGDVTLIGTLPSGISPSRNVFTLIRTWGGTYADVVIQPNGQIRLIDPRPPAVKDYTFVSLDDIVYVQ